MSANNRDAKAAIPNRRHDPSVNDIAVILHGTRLLIGLATILGVVCGCRHNTEIAPPRQLLPASLVGDFVDDYGTAYAISPQEWFQKPRARYRISQVDTVAGYLVARNDLKNPGEPGLLSRIDWVRLDMAPYEWAFSLSAYAALTEEAAQATTTVQRDTPRTGCNRHPFSRMRRAGPADTLKGTAYPR